MLCKSLLAFNKFKISFLETSGIFFPKYAFIIIIIIIEG